MFPDSAFAIAVDDSGNVYVTGYSYDSATYQDYATIKYYPNGDTAWVRRYYGPGNSWDEARAIAVDDSGNVYVTGFSTGDGTDYDYATMKYSANGETSWVRRYDGPASGYDAAYALTVHDPGNVCVTGVSWGGVGSKENYTTIKYGPSGSIVWLEIYDKIGNASGGGICHSRR